MDQARAFSPGPADQTTLYYCCLARFTGLTQGMAGFSQSGREDTFVVLAICRQWLKPL